MEKETGQHDSLGFKPQFKPMTEGLGLDHFADGLPYTPSSARRRPMVQFSYPPPRAPRPPAETIDNVYSGEFPAQTMAVAADTTDDLAREEEPVYAGIVRRTVAYLFDLGFLSAIFAGIVWAAFWLNGFDIVALLSSRQGGQMLLPLGLLYLVVYFGYFLIQETTWRRTLGKSLAGIHIRAQSGLSTLGRSVCFFAATIPFGVGLLWYFFDSRHRCWHDVITNSEVVLD